MNTPTNNTRRNLLKGALALPLFAGVALPAHALPNPERPIDEISRLARRIAELLAQMQAEEGDTRGYYPRYFDHIEIEAHGVTSMYAEDVRRSREPIVLAEDRHRYPDVRKGGAQ